MTARRLFVPWLPDQGGSVVLGDAVSRHVRVLRLRVGDEIVLFDGHGGTASARIATLDRDRIVCDADARAALGGKHTRVVLLLAVPKGSKVNDCVRMATELGVGEVALMQTERTVPRWDSDRGQTRVDRLTRIASEAAAQCERADIPLIHAPRSCEAWLKTMPTGARGVLFGARAGGGLGALSDQPEQVWCAIGPEGGFTESEVELFRRHGFGVASLGARILRIDTAVAAALALIQDRLRQPR